MTASWRSYRDQRRKARVATTIALLVASWLAYRVVRLAVEGRLAGIVVWLLFVAYTTTSVLTLRARWKRLRKARPEPITDPDEPAPPPRQHQVFSGEIEPPQRW